MGSRIGILKIAAKRVGLSFEDYIARIESGLKWCNGCKTWKEVSKFGNDRTRGDGLDAKCLDCRHVKERKSTKGRVSTFKGRHHTEEAKKKMSKDRKGNKRRLGRTHTEETRRKISELSRERTPRGEVHYAYSHGQYQRDLDDRRRAEYTEWRTAVFARDKYTCQKCGDNRGGNLHAHHIKPFSDYPEIRFEISNGVTLCERCHDVIHYGKPRCDRG